MSYVLNSKRSKREWREENKQSKKEEEERKKTDESIDHRDVRLQYAAVGRWWQTKDKDAERTDRKPMHPMFYHHKALI